MYQDDYLDEYEEDEVEQEEGEAEEEYEEEKEDPKPSKEELEYLALRQRLKENLRKQLKKQNGTSFGNSQEKKKLPYDNYGSFFGPSQPVIAPRVIQESKSLLENQHLTSRASNSNNTSKKVPASTNSQTRPAVRDPPPRIVNEEKKKVQKLKENRDYSFLMSDDAELPVLKNEQPSRNISASNSRLIQVFTDLKDARPAQVPSKSSVSISNLSKTVSNGRDDRKLISTNRPLLTKSVHHQVDSGSNKPNMSSDPRKQLGRITGSGPGRPVGPKGLPSKMPASTKTPISKTSSATTMDRKASFVGAKKPVPVVHKSHLTKPHPSVQKKHLEQRKILREPDKVKLNSKMPVSSHRPQIKSPRQMPPRAPLKEEHAKKRPPRPFMDEDDEDDPHAIIRKMFRYDPLKYAGIDEDDSNMEANFDDIIKEERRSAKIAKEEDERELKLIEEEERRERLRKEAKKRKLSHH